MIPAPLVAKVGENDFIINVSGVQFHADETYIKRLFIEVKDALGLNINVINEIKDYGTN